MVTHQLEKAMEELDIPPIPEFIEMISDSGAGLYACKASVDMFKLDARRLHRPGRRHHHRRRVLREGRRRPDHLHVTPTRDHSTTRRYPTAVERWVRCHSQFVSSGRVVLA